MEAESPTMSVCSGGAFPVLAYQPQPALHQDLVTVLFIHRAIPSMKVGLVRLGRLDDLRRRLLPGMRGTPPKAKMEIRIAAAACLI
jgi:hypothetical protein